MSLDVALGGLVCNLTRVFMAMLGLDVRDRGGGPVDGAPQRNALEQGCGRQLFQGRAFQFTVRK